MNGLNAKEVLKNLEEIMEKGKSVPIDDVYRDLSIFDWWKDNLSITNQKDMKEFLETAISYGYTGYVCFKVGATGCANGMWAHKKESTTGYSPDGEVLYKSFAPDRNYWDAKLANDTWLAEKEERYDSINTIRKLRERLKCFT